jgi:hypothetical protein
VRDDRHRDAARGHVHLPPGVQVHALAGSSGAVLARRKFTPPAGTHTYRILAKSNSGGQVKADVGGSGKLFPGFIRILQKGLA